jgi:hypothetical protein
MRGSASASSSLKAARTAGRRACAHRRSRRSHPPSGRAFSRRHHGQDAYTGRSARAETAPGVPVFRVLRTVYDTEGRPVEVQDSVAAADRHQFRYEVEMR